RALLKGLYEIILDSRSSKGDIWRFRDLCITYCGYKG
ncbi:MAG: DNA polymerase III subunit delta, partial [Veillonella sp.]|nr:DNA polymerase III subunit delta [Veillonella sp.]